MIWQFMLPSLHWHQFQCKWGGFSAGACYVVFQTFGIFFFGASKPLCVQLAKNNLQLFLPTLSLSIPWSPTMVSNGVKASALQDGSLARKRSLGAFFGRLGTWWRWPPNLSKDGELWTWCIFSHLYIVQEYSNMFWVYQNFPVDWTIQWNISQHMDGESVNPRCESRWSSNGPCHSRGAGFHSWITLGA